jgi:hypothetical protein
MTTIYTKSIFQSAESEIKEAKHEEVKWQISKSIDEASP